MNINQRLRSRLANQEGSALIIALMAMMLLTALGAAVVMVSNTESRSAGNYRNSQEALYAADAAVERVVQDLLLVPAGTTSSTAPRSPALSTATTTADQTLPGGGHGDALLRRQHRHRSASGRHRHARICGARTIRAGSFSPGARSSNMLPDNQIDSSMYVAVWVADDPADGTGGVIDGDPRRTSTAR